MSATPDTKGLAAARRYSRWHIGDAYWADQIIAAYLNPEDTNRRLDEEQG